MSSSDLTIAYLDIAIGRELETLYFVRNIIA